MGFFQLLKSLDELLYEVMSWLVFYPITLWRALRHPWRMMDYADTELADQPAEQYSDTLSPPLFLFLTILLSHGIELALIGDSPIVANTVGLAGLIDDDTSLLILRLISFGALPLILSARLVRQSGRKLDRAALKPPFYSQCYVAAPFALMMGLAGTATQLHWHWAPIVAVGAAGLALLWYGSLQVRWYAEHLNVSLVRGFAHASVAMVECVVALAVVSALFA